jgi:hypothetical protein
MKIAAIDISTWKIRDFTTYVSIADMKLDVDLRCTRESFTQLPFLNSKEQVWAELGKRL